MSEASAKRGDRKTVRVEIPREIAMDFDAFQKVQRSILDRLGCGACCSDFDIRWGYEPDFRINSAGEFVDG